jgi:predicted anti-sigma-YlaC factor YlaD
MTHDHSPDSADCRALVEHLSDYLDGETEEALRRAIEAHGGHCPPCRAFLRTLQATVRLVRDLPRAEPLPPALKRALIDALERARTPL